MPWRGLWWLFKGGGDMDRVAEIRQILETLKTSGYIEIRKEIPETELLAIVMPGETLEETVANILKLLK